MLVGKRNISRENIELEIYKTFEQFKKQKNISISEYLKSLDVSVFGKKNYRKIKFSYDSLIKLVLFQKLKGIKFQTQLRKYLKKHKKERYRLNLERIPDRRTINYFINHILNEETKELKIMLKDHLDLYYSGFLENAYMEMCEANILYSIVKNEELPTVEELGVTNSSYLLGLGDVIGELRRIVLNSLRKGEIEKAVKYLDKMEEIYLIIMRFNYPNSLVNIKRKQDIARGLLEKTRGEVTFAIRGKSLEEKIVQLEKKMS